MSELNAFLRSIAPTLKEIRSNFWISGENAPVSYPDGAHTALANVEKSSFWFRHRNKIIATVVRRFSGAKPLFEIGGGNGFVSLGLKQSGIPTVVVEPGAQGAAIAADRGLIVVNSTFSEDTFETESLPSIGLFDVIEHIDDDLAFLQACHRALAPDGFLYITVPASPALWSVDDEYAGHFRRYTREGLAKVLQSAGFEPVQVSGFFLLLVPPLMLLRTLPSKMGLRRVGSADEAITHHTDGVVSRFIGAVSGTETRAIANGLELPAGTSLIAVARKR